MGRNDILKFVLHRKNLSYYFIPVCQILFVLSWSFDLKKRKYLPLAQLLIGKTIIIDKELKEGLNFILPDQFQFPPIEIICFLLIKRFFCIKFCYKFSLLFCLIRTLNIIHIWIFLGLNIWIIYLLLCELSFIYDITNHRLLYCWPCIYFTDYWGSVRLHVVNYYLPRLISVQTLRQ